MIYNHFMENSITEAFDMLVFSPKLERGFAGVPVISPLWDVLKLPQLGCWHLCYLNRGGTQQSHRRYWLCLTDIPMLCPPALLWAEMKPPQGSVCPPSITHCSSTAGRSCWRLLTQQIPLFLPALLLWMLFPLLLSTFQPPNKLLLASPCTSGPW